MFAGSEIAGFAASALVLVTFAMRDMRLLRATAICSNVAFIIYGAINGLLPVLVLHVLLLPWNFLRLREIIDAKRPVATGPGGDQPA